MKPPGILLSQYYNFSFESDITGIYKLISLILICLHVYKVNIILLCCFSTFTNVSFLALSPFFILLNRCFIYIIDFKNRCLCRLVFTCLTNF